jgi:2-polyprenyl-3-methyl-5-hydroxy-6-metoxy-1,4-benzoquinol methylase
MRKNLDGARCDPTSLNPHWLEGATLQFDSSGSLAIPPNETNSTLHHQSKAYWAQCDKATVATSSYYDRQAQVLAEEILPGLGSLKSVLDIGCADGRFTQIFSRHAGQVLGIDISAPLISAARRAAAQASHISFEVQDAEAMLPSGPFDLISCMGVLSTLVDDRAFEHMLEEIANRVPDRGWLITKDTVSTVEVQRRVEVDHALIYRNWQQYRRAVEHAGFELTFRCDLAHWSTTQVNALCVWRRKGAEFDRPKTDDHVRNLSVAITELQQRQTLQSDLMLEMAATLQTLAQGLEKIEKHSVIERRMTSSAKPSLPVHARLRKGSPQRIRCAFIIHHATAWAALRPVVDLMLAAPDFEPILISSPHSFPMLQRMGGEVEVYNMLRAQGYSCLRLRDEEAHLAVRMMESLVPDVVFRQAPWDKDLPAGFSTEALSFTRVCYVPYGYLTAKIEQHQFNQIFHQNCWRIFCPDEMHLQLFSEHNLVGGLNCRVTGYPKFDDLLRYNGDRNAWPLPAQPDDFRLIWAPHYSHDVDWLRFGAFMQTAPALVKMIESDPRLQVVLRPHPAMLECMLHGPQGTPLAKFAKTWAQLPNTALSISPDYGDLFSASDALLTDGLSFFSEYQLFDKPLIFFDRQDHVGFNSAGSKLLAGMYRVTDGEQMCANLQALRTGIENQEIVAHRRRIANELRPFPGEAAKRIMQIIRSDLLLTEDLGANHARL